jgi:hypothetical protein
VIFLVGGCEPRVSFGPVVFDPILEFARFQAATFEPIAPLNCCMNKNVVTFLNY